MIDFPSVPNLKSIGFQIRDTRASSDPDGSESAREQIPDLAMASGHQGRVTHKNGVGLSTHAKCRANAGEPRRYWPGAPAPVGAGDAVGLALPEAGADAIVIIAGLSSPCAAAAFGSGWASAAGPRR